MIQDVTVKHPRAGPLIKHHQKSDDSVEWHIDGVLPGERTDRLQFVVERQEEEAVQMKRVRELAVVSDRPDLLLAERGEKGLRLPGWYAVHLELRVPVSVHRRKAEDQVNVSRPSQAGRLESAADGRRRLRRRQRRLICELDRYQVREAAVLNAPVAAVV